MDPNSPLNQLDIKGLAADLGKQATEILQGILGGAKELAPIGIAIGANSAHALLLPPDRKAAVLKTNRETLDLLFERSRLKVNAAQRQALDKALNIMDTVTGILINNLIRTVVI